jgi:hypothetical protein
MNPIVIVPPLLVVLPVLVLLLPELAEPLLLPLDEHAEATSTAHIAAAALTKTFRLDTEPLSPGGPYSPRFSCSESAT